MSQTLFEIRRVFQQQRKEIGQVNDDGFSIDAAISQYGQDQLLDNLRHMFAKEAGNLPQKRTAVNYQHNPVDYLAQNFGGKVTAACREEAVLCILQFSV